MTRAVDLANLGSSLGSGGLLSFRNKIINGNFDFWQRGTSFSNPAAYVYTSDRWLAAYDGTGASRTLSRQAFTLGQTAVPSNPSYFYRFAQTGAGSGGTFNLLLQRIEGVSTFAGQTFTLSFYAKAAASLTMPFIQFFQNFGSGGSPSDTVYNTIASSIAITTSFTKYTFTVTLPSISGKTLGTDGNDYLALVMYLPINTTFTFDLAQVQVEAGSVATPFEQRFLGNELALCQRYYEQYGPGFRVNVATCANDSSTTTRGVVIWQTTKRTAPTVGVSGGFRTLGANQGNGTTLSFIEINILGAQAVGTSSYTQGQANYIQSDDTLTGLIQVSAEL